MNKSYGLFYPVERSARDTPLRQAQLIMLRILRIIDWACRKHGITYWLDGGTLLGAVRHSGFIPWDDDLDIAMPRKEFERFAVIAQQELPDDLFFQTATTDANYHYVLPKVRDRNSRMVEDVDNVLYCQGTVHDWLKYRWPAGGFTALYC